MASRDPAIASAAGSYAAHTDIARLTRTQRRERTAPARARMWQMWLDRAAELLGPEATQEDLEASAASLRKAHMAALQLASAQAKAAKRTKVAA
jgi:type IV secretory pathway VirD2 relaxase